MSQMRKPIVTPIDHTVFSAILLLVVLAVAIATKQKAGKIVMYGIGPFVLVGVGLGRLMRQGGGRVYNESGVPVVVKSENTDATYQLASSESPFAVDGVATSAGVYKVDGITNAVVEPGGKVRKLGIFGNVETINKLYVRQFPDWANVINRTVTSDTAVRFEG